MQLLVSISHTLFLCHPGVAREDEVLPSHSTVQYHLLNIPVWCRTTPIMADTELLNLQDKGSFRARSISSRCSERSPRSSCEDVSAEKTGFERAVVIEPSFRVELKIQTSFAYHKNWFVASAIWRKCSKQKCVLASLFFTHVWNSSPKNHTNRAERLISLKKL